MQRNDEVLTVETCDICGDVGYPELLVTCSECNVIHQHCYCMQILLNEVPDVWFCESCQSKNGTTSPCKVNQDAGLQATERFLHKDEVNELSSCNFPATPIPTTSTLLMFRKAYVGSKNVTPKIPSLALKSNPCISPMVLPRNEVLKNQMTDHAPRSSSEANFPPHLLPSPSPASSQSDEGKDMPRTRGGHVSISAAAISRERIAAATETERADGYRQVHDEPQREEPQHIEQVDAHAPTARESFTGGPYDMSVLTQYEHHVAAQIWIGRDRRPLKVHSHGNKLNDWLEKINPIPPYVAEVITRSGLSSLLSCSFTMIDTALLSAFVERWHGETSSFHLPVGEITVTLDDVCCLLHLPVEGALFSNLAMEGKDPISYLHEILGVSYADARMNVEHIKGANMSFLWLEKIYNEACEAQNWVIATRAFMMHLLGCTILTNKSQTGIDIKYLDLVRDLERCSTWSWGSIALCVLYQNLTDASMSNTKQIAGYMTLLQAWIYEHFPTICSRKERVEYTEDNCRASRWLPKRGTGRVLPFRRALDALINPLDVCWTPYTEHRPYVPFDDVLLYSGYIRFCSIMVPHLPERVLRQFGYVQDIPRPPKPVPTTEVLDYCWTRRHEHSVRNTTCEVNARCPGECTMRYLRWFYVVSHPRLTPSDSKNQVHDSHTQCVPVGESFRLTQSACCNDSCFDTKKMLNEAAGIIQTMACRESRVDPTPHDGNIQRLLRIVQGGTEAGPSSRRNVFDSSSSEE